MNPVQFDKKKLIQAFNKTAKSCQEANTLNHEIAHRLFQRLDFIKTQPQTILDIGCGTGDQISELSIRYPTAHTIGLDIAKKRLVEAQKKNPSLYICADAEDLPIEQHTIDLVFSNLSLHWCDDLSKIFQNIRKILRPNGLLLFSMLGVDTLQEINDSWHQVEKIHIPSFPDMHHIGDALLQAGFQDPVMDMEQVILEYPNLEYFLLNMKQSGFTHLFYPDHLSKKKYEQFKHIIEQHYKSENGIPITFEIIYGYALSKFAIIQESSCASTTSLTPPRRLTGQSTGPKM